MCELLFRYRRQLLTETVVGKENHEHQGHVEKVQYTEVEATANEDFEVSIAVYNLFIRGRLRLIDIATVYDQSVE